jgi:lipoprotein-anchoring transpeptidase ErfK/SrfK
MGRGLALGLLGLAAAASAPAASAAAPDTPVVPARPTSSLVWTGEVVAPVSARTDSDPSARAVMVLQPIAPLGGGITALQITDRRRGADGRLWVRVLLPRRPNGTQGWVPADHLRLARNPFRIRVDLSRRTLTLFRSGTRLRQVRVAVGTPQNPTPVGRFAIAEEILTRTPGAFLGPVVLPLTGFSETLNDYAGGNGRVAIHGTSLPQLLGTRASHGCVRVHNRDIAAIARLVRPGTPVLITP